MDQDRLIIAEERNHPLDAAAGAEDLLFFRQADLKAGERMEIKPGADLVGEMVDVDSDAIKSRSGKAAQGDLEQGAAREGNQCFRGGKGERVEPGAETRRQYHRFHTNRGMSRCFSSTA